MVRIMRKAAIRDVFVAMSLTKRLATTYHRQSRSYLSLELRYETPYFVDTWKPLLDYQLCFFRDDRHLICVDHEHVNLPFSLAHLGLKKLSMVMPRSLVESRSLIEMPFSESVRERTGAKPIERWPHLFSFKGMSHAEAQSHA